MNFEHEELYKKYVEAIQKRKIILFGAGHKSQELLGNYFKHGEVFSIWDNDPLKNGKELYGYCITLPPKRLEEEPDKYVVIVSAEDEIAALSIKRQLRNLGIRNVFSLSITSFINKRNRYNTDFTYNFHEKNTYDIVCKNEDRIKRVLELLADDKSKYVYERIISKMKYNIENYADVCDDPYDHYFSDGVFSYASEEVFIDGGAFRGEDTIRLAEIIGIENIRRVYCFEPDFVNYQKCKRNISDFFAVAIDRAENDEYQDNRFKVFNAGIWDSNDYVGFDGSGTQSATVKLEDDSTSERIQTIKIDDVIIPEDKVTFIKMDVEGAEGKALNGAIKILKRDRPKLAISIYHKIEDLWDIPLYIHELVPEYKLYVRHHTNGVWDSILYARID